MRAAHAAMQAQDRDAIRKFACWLAQHFDIAGFESLQIKTMTESANARGVANVEQVQRLNRSIRRSCWRVTQDAAAAAVEAGADERSISPPWTRATRAPSADASTRRAGRPSASGAPAARTRTTPTSTPHASCGHERFDGSSCAQTPRPTAKRTRRYGMS